tara:strand:+ start:300 stop:797 length:498 start_codon:yes stop_codon:yes gene_type:complete
MISEDRYCSFCARLLDKTLIQGVERPTCLKCRRVIYYDPKLAVTVVIEVNGKVIMVKRAVDPGKGLWGFPGGYVNRGERVEDGAAREVNEETGLIVTIDRLIGLFSEPNNPIVLAVYSGHKVGGCLNSDSIEVMDVEGFSLNHLPPLAFERDLSILETWKKRKSL